MKKTELENCPKWLLDANTLHEDVEWSNGVNSSIVWLYGEWHGGQWRGEVWHGGLWRSGLWHGGEWRSGEWRYGLWHDGLWHGGQWCGGQWRGGVWHGGLWRDGVWRDGVWCGGVWHGGVWHDGLWYGGEWRNGLWLGGEWRGGVTAQKSKYVPMIKGSKLIVGCVSKSPEEWLAWIDSEEEYKTPRNTEEFRMIRAHILATITYMEAMKEETKTKTGETHPRRSRTEPNV